MLATSVEKTDLQKQGNMYSVSTTNSIRLTKMQSQRHPTPFFVLGKCSRPSSADMCIWHYRSRCMSDELCSRLTNYSPSEYL